MTQHLFWAGIVLGVGVHFMYIARTPQLCALQRGCLIPHALVTTLAPNGTGRKTQHFVETADHRLPYVTINSHYFPVQHSPIRFYNQDA